MAVFNPMNPLADVTPRFSEEQMELIVSWFDRRSKPLLVLNEDEEPIKAVTVEQVRTFLRRRILHRRSLYNPSYADIMDEVEALNMGVYRMLTKDQFIYVLNKWVLEPDMKHELKLAFQVFDTEERQFLEVDLLRELLTTYGETPFNDEEIIEFLRDANVKGDGNVFYSDFVESLFKLAPELSDLEKEYLYEDPDEDPSVAPLPEEPSDREPQPRVLLPPPPLPAPPAPPSKTPAKGADKKKK